MERSCDSCGRAYEAKRAASKFCGPTCRVRASRGAVAPEVRALEPRPAADAGLVDAVRDDLENAGRVGTSLGQASLALAERIGSGLDTGSGLAALTRELRATLAAAMDGAAVAADPLDELRSRRDRKHAG